MTSVEYVDQFFEALEARKNSGTLTNYTVVDSIFTTVNLITNNFIAFTPKEREIRRFFEEKGRRTSDVLLDEYIEAIRYLMTKKIKRSPLPRSMNSFVEYALKEDANESHHHFLSR